METVRIGPRQTRPPRFGRSKSRGWDAMKATLELIFADEQKEAVQGVGTSDSEWYTPVGMRAEDIGDAQPSKVTALPKHQAKLNQCC